MPNDDVMDDPNAAESQPTAPPMEKMDQIGGYSNVGFNASKCLRAKNPKKTGGFERWEFIPHTPSCADYSRFVSMQKL